MHGIVPQAMYTVCIVSISSLLYRPYQSPSPLSSATPSERYFAIAYTFTIHPWTKAFYSPNQCTINGHLGDLVKVSCIERCPHFRGKCSYITKAYLRHSKVSLFQGCPLREVLLNA